MLILDRISKQYADGSTTLDAIRSISLKVKSGSIIALLGPNGCGKTTLLKIVAGLESQSSGIITINGKEAYAPNKNKGFVFQNYSLFSWLCVSENIGFGVSLQHMAAKQRQRIVEKYLKIIQLDDFGNSYPKDLSGGMQQRVAIARTLANNPKIVLMDEPFRSLDMQTKIQMHEFLLQMWEKTHKTILFVTHDIEEAIFLADTVCVFSRRPAEIKKIFSVPFVRPRLASVKYAQQFITLKKKIAQELEA